MMARCHSGFSIPRGACRARACSIICRWRGFSGRRPASRWARSSPAKARSTETGRAAAARGAEHRCAGRGSARLAGAIIRETLAVGGRACRPLIAREGLGSTLVEPALAHLQQRGAAVRMEHQLRALRFAAERVEALDFGGETVRFGRRRGRSGGAALYRRVVGARPRRADGIPRHRQRAFPHRAAARAAADPRRAQRHGAMAVCLPGPAVRHHQRRRPAHRRAA